MEFEKLIKNLQRNNIDCLVFENGKAAADYLEQTLKAGASISSGGSVTLAETGILNLIKSEKYNYLDRLNENLSEEQKQNVFKEIIGADYYFCSANAITENGELINVDGFANRITALTFGPKKVFAVIGTNKIVKDVKEGFLRVKKIAAPKNCVRLKIDNPCAKLGKCVSLLKSENPDITEGCDSTTRICRNYIITSKQAIKGRITVLLIKEDLGY